MKFQLEEYNRNTPDEELLSDLRKVANELGRNTISRSEYDSKGRFHSSTFANRFGSWNKSKEKAGLSVLDTAPTDDHLINDLKRVAAEMGKSTITTGEYKERGKYHSSTLIRRFSSNGWNKMLEKAGLEVTQFRDVSTDVLFENIEEVWLKLGRQPHYREMSVPLSKYGGKMYVNRFGSWMSALKQFVDAVNSEETEQGIASIELAPVNEPPKRTNTKEQTTSVITKPNAQHKTKRDINWRLRFLVMRRDNFKCVACGRSPATDPTVILHVDHVLAWDKGGETVFENLQALCSVCNIGKSNLEFREKDTL